MALRRSLRGRRLMAEINVVPYIDVMLVLVVILMVAAPFVNPSLINLPSVNKAAKAPEKVIEVIVFADKKLSIRVGKKMTPVDMAGLPSAVRNIQEGNPEVPVVIAADKSVQYEDVINVMKALQRADIERVGLSLKIERSTQGG